MNAPARGYYFTLACTRRCLLIDDQVAAIGSANITDAALGFADQPNAEVMAVLQPVPNRLFLFLRHLERDASSGNRGTAAEVRGGSESVVAPPWTSPVVDVTGDVPRGPVSLFPCFRNPEQLYRGYVSVVEFSDHETRAAILDDLGVLGSPGRPRRADFPRNESEQVCLPSKQSGPLTSLWRSPVISARWRSG